VIITPPKRDDKGAPAKAAPLELKPDTGTQ
jgi:hypothetical protein